MFELLQEGKRPPGVDEVAARAGVSTASVFRYFDGVDDMQRQAFTRFRERFGDLYEIPAVGAGPRDVRVKAFVGARLRLYDVVAPMLAMARIRAIEHDPAAEAVASNRMRLADQVRAQFAREIDGLTPSRATDLVALVDSLTSPEAWEIVRRGHGRSGRQITQLWTLGVTVVLDGYHGQESAA